MEHRLALFLLVICLAFIGGCEEPTESDLPVNFSNPPAGSAASAYHFVKNGRHEVQYSDSAYAVLDTVAPDSSLLTIVIGDEKKEFRLWLPNADSFGRYSLDLGPSSGQLSCLVRDNGWYTSIYGYVTITELSIDNHYISGSFRSTLSPVQGSASDSIAGKGTFKRIRLN